MPRQRRVYIWNRDAHAPYQPAHIPAFVAPSSPGTIDMALAGDGAKVARVRHVGLRMLPVLKVFKVQLAL